MRKIFRIFFFWTGWILCAYPLISNFFEYRNHERTIDTYEMKLEDCDKENEIEMLMSAIQYNRLLYQTKKIVSHIPQEENLSLIQYEHLLDPLGTGMIGSIEIPKINVNLPIYHGTEESVLSIGIGHMKDSSLPVGGVNTRAVLTGHRGLPDSKLFTRLDELKTGDLFYIHVLSEVLAYQVVDIEIIEPEETDKLEVVDNKDLVTLVTCTPYGINTHRLIVTGERIPYEKEVHLKIEQNRWSLRECIFVAIPILIIAYGAVIVIKSIKKRGGKYEAKKI